MIRRSIPFAPPFALPHLAVCRAVLVLLCGIALATLAGCATPQVPPPRAGLRPAPLPPPAALGFRQAQQVAIACARTTRFDVAAFTACTRQEIILTPRQQALLDCALTARGDKSFAECAAPQVGITLSRPQIVTTNCAMRSQGTKSRFLACTGTAAAGKKITPHETALLECAARSNDDAVRFTACSAMYVVGDRATPEQRIAIACAAESGGDYAAFLTCAGANLFNVRLNPDQVIAVQCVLATVGQPVAAVGCMATRFVVRELRSCASKGFGGAHGCFGDDNEVIGRNGWTVRTVSQLTGGAQTMLHDEAARWNESALAQKSWALWAGSGAFIRNPRGFWAAHAAATPQ